MKEYEAGEKLDSDKDRGGAENYNGQARYEDGKKYEGGEHELAAGYDGEKQDGEGEYERRNGYDGKGEEFGVGEKYEGREKYREEEVRGGVTYEDGRRYGGAKKYEGNEIEEGSAIYRAGKELGGDYDGSRYGGGEHNRGGGELERRGSYQGGRRYELGDILGGRYRRRFICGGGRRPKLVQHEIEDISPNPPEESSFTSSSTEAINARLANLKQQTFIIKIILKAARTCAARALSKAINECILNDFLEIREFLLSFAYNYFILPPSNENRKDSLSTCIKRNINITNSTPSCVSESKYPCKKRINPIKSIINKESDGDLSSAIKLPTSSDSIADFNGST
ncbi:hypothetical protein JTB14_020472 [Gonioctena quinquepunctata]|nr:hypothetical protein JTB14_020472 [Gonioctena quinquepunctata]